MTKLIPRYTEEMFILFNIEYELTRFGFLDSQFHEEDKLQPKFGPKKGERASCLMQKYIFTAKKSDLADIWLIGSKNGGFLVISLKGKFQ